MALKFGNTKGTAVKDKMPSFDYILGDNTVRLVGDVLARYVYWIKGENDKFIPFECLSFDRDQEKFTNVEKDWVKEFFPDMNCTWSYSMLCIADGELKLINLKKKLFESIIDLSDDLGDPTDPKEGWDIKFKKEKTGPQVYNIEYTVQPFKCKKRPLNDAEMELIAEMKSMDDVLPRPTPEQQKELLDRITGVASKENVDEESLDDAFNVSG